MRKITTQEKRVIHFLMIRHKRRKDVIINIITQKSRLMYELKYDM